MNNSIIIKGADFSTNRIGKLMIQKLSITSDGVSIKKADNNGILYTVQDSANFVPSKEIVHSQEITVPEGAKYLFGKFTAIAGNDEFDNFKNNANVVDLSAYAATPWAYFSSAQNKWVNVNAIKSTVNTKPSILAYKQNTYANGDYTGCLLEGGIYSILFNQSLQITKMIFNWVKKGAAVAPEIGLEVPELYLVF